MGPASLSTLPLGTRLPKPLLSENLPGILRVPYFLRFLRFLFSRFSFYFLHSVTLRNV